MLQFLFHVFPKFSIECYRHNLQVFGCENDKITLFEATCSHQPLYLRVISIICLKFDIEVIIQVTMERVKFACFSNGCMSIFITTLHFYKPFITVAIKGCYNAIWTCT